MNKILIYTDGACKGNPGPGGWGVVIIENNKETELYGKENNTTNNIMELTAPIKALEYFKSKKNIIIYTDSNYVKLGITDWINKWKKNNWLNSKKIAVKNKSYWMTLDKLNHFHNIDWRWVKAHNGDFYNERADFLATNAI
jgi:ribonuclease HI